MTGSAWRKRVKAIGHSLSLMMLGLWVFSVMFVSYYVPPSTQWSISLGFGRIGFVEGHANNPGWSCSSQSNAFWPQMSWTQFARHWLGFRLPGKDRWGVVIIPIWLLVVAVGFPTALLWWRDGRPKAGCCKVCKYDLTGNVSRVCPECGTKYSKASNANKEDVKP